MPGYEGILTLAIRMRVSPKPMKKTEPDVGDEPPEGNFSPLERGEGQQEKILLEGNIINC